MLVVMTGFNKLVEWELPEHSSKRKKKQKNNQKCL